MKFLTTEGIVIGVLLGGLLVTWSVITEFIGHHHIIHEEDAIQETLWTAVFLTMVVAYCHFKLPTPFARTRPVLALFTLGMLCGHVSLFFDSFAVVLLLTTLTLTAAQASKHSHNYNAFAVKVICSHAALTVGGGFYIGELWGLPYYISSGYDNPIAGLPLLAVLTPYCAFTSFVMAKLHPVKIEPVHFDKKQWRGTIEIAVLLTLIIVTHKPVFCIGALLVYAALTGTMNRMVHNTLHELGSGAFSALGLIMAALVIQQLPGTKEWFAEHLRGANIFFVSMLSSPFAGAMTEGSRDLDTFYANLSWIMAGAPMFVSSSLVAIVVFRDTLHYADLPNWVKPLARPFRNSESHIVSEAIVYTLMIVPLNAGLALCLWLANMSGIFPAIYRWLSAVTGIA